MADSHRPSGEPLDNRPDRHSLPACGSLLSAAVRPRSRGLLYYPAQSQKPLLCKTSRSAVSLPLHGTYLVGIL